MIDMPIGPACPDCKAGKHDNCTGGSWDNETDQPAICECWHRGHENGASE